MFKSAWQLVVCATLLIAWALLLVSFASAQAPSSSTITINPPLPPISGIGPRGEIIVVNPRFGAGGVTPGFLGPDCKSARLRMRWSSLPCAWDQPRGYLPHEVDPESNQ